MTIDSHETIDLSHDELMISPSIICTLMICPLTICPLMIYPLTIKVLLMCCCLCVVCRQTSVPAQM
jgi:hypothetical protein